MTTFAHRSDDEDRLPLRTVSGSFVRITAVQDDLIPSDRVFSCASGIREASPHEGRVLLPRRLARLRIEGLQAMLYSREFPVDPCAHDVVALALAAGAQGVLTWSPRGALLTVFPRVSAQIAVEDEQLVRLALPEAIADPVLRRRLSEDEDLLLGFAEALDGGSFEEWLDTVAEILDLGERARLSAAYSHFR